MGLGKEAFLLSQYLSATLGLEMKKQKILVVEDDPLNMELVTDLLEIAGYTVLKAETAEQGIEVARSANPVLILMDVRLPDFDGLSATGILKNDPLTSHIPVVALTASVMPGDEARSSGRRLHRLYQKAYQYEGISGDCRRLY